MKIDLLNELKKANEVLRSCYQVAAREGKETNWEPFLKTIDNILKEQHEILYPTKNKKKAMKMFVIKYRFINLFKGDFQKVVFAERKPTTLKHEREIFI